MAIIEQRLTATGLELPEPFESSRGAAYAFRLGPGARHLRLHFGSRRVQPGWDIAPLCKVDFA